MRTVRPLRAGRPLWLGVGLLLPTLLVERQHDGTPPPDPGPGASPALLSHIVHMAHQFSPCKLVNITNRADAPNLVHFMNLLTLPPPRTAPAWLPRLSGFLAQLDTHRVYM